MEGELIFVDLQPLVAVAFAFQDQGIVARLLQMEAEAAATVRGGQNSGLGRKGGDIEPGGTGSTGTG